MIIETTYLEGFQPNRLRFFAALLWKNTKWNKNFIFRFIVKKNENIFKISKWIHAKYDFAQPHKHAYIFIPFSVKINKLNIFCMVSCWPFEDFFRVCGLEAENWFSYSFACSSSNTIWRKWSDVSFRCLKNPQFKPMGSCCLLFSFSQYFSNLVNRQRDKRHQYECEYYFEINLKRDLT